MKREARFVGNGNCWIANSRYRGWQVSCQCGITKTITSHDGSSMPPFAIIKKLEKAGWHIGMHPVDDRCPSCQRKPKPARNGHAEPPPMTFKLVEPATKDWNNAEEYFSRLQRAVGALRVAMKAQQHKTAIVILKDVASLVDPQVTAAVIASLKPPPPMPAPVPAPPVKPASTDNGDYDKWLAELEAH